MRNHRGQRGEGNAGCLIGLIVLALVGYLAYKMIPVKVKAADLKQTVTDEAKMAGSHGDSVIVNQILATARKNQLPVTEDNIKINRSSAEITVDVDYDVPIDFPGKTWNWHQHITAQNPIF
jgi:type III secretion system FlhB-like substrate exporter